LPVTTRTRVPYNNNAWRVRGGVFIAIRRRSFAWWSLVSLLARDFRNTSDLLGHRIILWLLEKRKRGNIYHPTGIIQQNDRCTNFYIGVSVSYWYRRSQVVDTHLAREESYEGRTWKMPTYCTVRKIFATSTGRLKVVLWKEELMFYDDQISSSVE
jgi:hypothetical protein